MSGFEITRRGFLVGCSSTVAAMAGARFNSLVYGNPLDQADNEILINVFLRGGMDILNFMPPLAGDDRGYYEAGRGSIAIPTNNSMQLGNSNFYLNPAASPFHDLFTDGSLAFIQGTGMFKTNRSHFDAMNYMDLGTPGNIHTDSGWLTRYLRTTPGANETPDPNAIPSLAMGRYGPKSLVGRNNTLSMATVNDFQLNYGPAAWRAAQHAKLREMYSMEASSIYQAGANAVNALDVVKNNLLGDYTPTSGAVYPEGSSFADHLQVVARIIKQQLGLRVATIDLGGWDTHEQQEGGNYFGDLVAEFTQSLSAFYADINTSQQNHTSRVTVVVMSEFGRRIIENGNAGTDHGRGSLMMVLGGAVNGGMHGTWPTLHPDALYQGIDLDTVVDYRQVLSEVLIRRLANPQLGYIFPEYRDYAPLGIVQGEDLPPVYDTTAVKVSSATTQTSNMAGKAATVAGVGLAATAGLMALRERGVAG